MTHTVTANNSTILAKQNAGGAADSVDERGISEKPTALTSSPKLTNFVETVSSNLLHTSGFQPRKM